MTSRRRVELAGLNELFERISPGRFEQPIAYCRVAEVRGHERFRDQVGNAIDDVPPCNLVIRRYRTSGLQREAAGENCQTTQHHALGLGQQLVAPVKRRSQRLMTRQCGPAAARQQGEAIVQPRGQTLDAECIDTGRCEFECQRDAVEAATNSGDHGDVARVRREPWRGRACPLDKQPDGAVAQRVLAIRAAFCRHCERRYRVNPLALDAERLAAGGDHARCRVGAQQRLGHLRRGLDHMLAIVEHQHELLRAQRVRDRERRCRARSKFEPERGCDGNRDQLRVGQRHQLDGPNPIGKSRQQVPCGRKAEPGLADAAGAGQGDEAVGGGEVQDLV